jgi:hypothetical protein
VAHVELSLSGLADLSPSTLDRTGVLERWVPAVTGAPEPSLLLDGGGIVVAASPGWAVLFATPTTDAVSQHVLSVMRLLDFNAVVGELPDWEAEKIPPLLAIAAGGLARGLMRVPGRDGAPVTVDAVSTPLGSRAAPRGSLTFFSPVSR